MRKITIDIKAVTVESTDDRVWSFNLDHRPPAKGAPPMSRSMALGPAPLIAGAGACAAVLFITCARAPDASSPVVAVAITAMLVFTALLTRAIRPHAARPAMPLEQAQEQAYQAGLREGLRASCSSGRAWRRQSVRAGASQR